MKRGSKLLESTIWVALAFLLANEINKNYGDEVINIPDQITANTNDDGGWGSWKGDRSRIVISAQILSMLRQIESLSTGDKIQNSINLVIDFLRKAQNADGGWGFRPSEKSNEVATSYALIGLSGIETCRI
jgi:prenyltransferase beta subunit